MRCAAFPAPACGCALTYQQRDISAPEDYDGGELIVDDTYGAHSVKLPAGDMIVWFQTSLHRVTPITRGARIASFFWTQSMIRDEGQRAV